MIKEKIKNLKEKGKEFVGKHKYAFCMTAGSAVTIAAALVGEKIFEPKGGCHDFIVYHDTGDIEIRNIYHDRFGRGVPRHQYNVHYDKGTQAYDCLIESMEQTLIKIKG